MKLASRQGYALRRVSYQNQSRAIKEKTRRAIRESTLSPAELILLKTITSRISKIDWDRKASPRDLAGVNWSHNDNFGERLRAMIQRNPSHHFQVLDEGAGSSTFLHDLRQELLLDHRFEKTKINFFTTDLRYNPPISPEQLLKVYGPESFDLIVSTMGGFSYTPFSREKALSNIAACLRPGGHASLNLDPLRVVKPSSNDRIDVVHAAESEVEHANKLISKLDQWKKRHPKIRLQVNPYWVDTGGRFGYSKLYFRIKMDKMVKSRPKTSSRRS